MKTQLFNSILFIVLVFHGTCLYSQSQTETNTSANDSSHFDVALNYISDAVFLGRKDTVSAPYLFTTMEYHHKSGVYAEGSVSYLTKSDQGRIDLFLLSAGYEKTFGKLNAEVSATKYFFNDDSYNVISAVEADLTAHFIYDFNILNLGWAGSIYFSGNNSSDFIMLTQVSHDFVTENKQWQFSPIFELQFGSQQFYEQYFIEQRIKKSGGSNGSGSGSGSGGNSSGSTITSEKIIESDTFSLMAIELNLAIWYQTPPFTFSFIPSYVIPSSEAEVWANDTLVKENIDNTFYWMAGISYRF